MEKRNIIRGAGNVGRRMLVDLRKGFAKVPDMIGQVKHAALERRKADLAQMLLLQTRNSEVDTEFAAKCLHLRQRKQAIAAHFIIGLTFADVKYFHKLPNH